MQFDDNFPGLSINYPFCRFYANFDYLFYTLYYLCQCFVKDDFKKKDSIIKKDSLLNR